MAKIVVFGAGGRAGRAAVREAALRGHQITAVVRDPAKYADLAFERGDGPVDQIRVVAGDVTRVDEVAALADGHDAAIAAVYDFAVAPEAFFTSAARALVAGSDRAGVPRLLVVGLASVLPTASGELLMDTPGYPQEYRDFYLGHAAGTQVLTAATALDWLVVSPAGDFDHGGDRTGGYRVAPADQASRVSYADLAVALLDEIDDPRHHRMHLGVERAG